jgi:predicted glycosyltransferase
MEVLVSIQHPAHVHFFKHAIGELRDRGHDVSVFALDRDVTLELLHAEEIDHTVLASRGPEDSVPLTQVVYEARLLQAARRLEPDVLTAVGGVSVSHVATLLGARSVVFTDTDHATLSNRLAFPFADRICTPTCYRGNAGPKQYAYRGSHELAYLHPDRFTPSPDVLEGTGVDPDDTVVVLRLIRWNAMHNVGGEGFSDLEGVVERLEATGATVLVTSEKPLPASLEDHRVVVEPHRMHDLLAYADLFVGESGTMTAESAVLGTPAVYVHENDTGLTEELAEYGLVFPHHGPDRHAEALEEAVEILADDDRDWAARRERMLEDKRDTTDVVVEQVLDTRGW